MLLEQSLPSYPSDSSRSLQQHIVLLQSHCKSLGHVSQIHAQITTNGFVRKSFILVKLLHLYSSYNKFSQAHKVFDQVPDPSTTLWNQIIRGYSMTGDARRSVISFRDMLLSSSALPNEHTFNYVINGCAKGRLLREGEQFHGKVLTSGFCANVHVGSSLVDLYVKCGGEDLILKARQVFDEIGERNAVTWNSLLSGCFKCGDFDLARRVFEEMPEKNVVSWTTMIGGCAQNGRCKEALDIFHAMKRENVEFDQVTLVAVLSACAELGDLHLGKWIHAYAVESWVSVKKPLLVTLSNALIHMYASCGEIDEAFAVFRGMKHRTVVSWTSMITGFAKHGYGDEALSVFHWMETEKGNNVRPDHITFLGVLCACSHSGYVDQGRYYFNQMVETFGIKPKIEHFGCMVDLLSRAGLLDEARELVTSMPMKPNDVVWGALLGGCRIHKRVELASDVAFRLTEGLDPDKAAGYLVLLSNVYAASKQWHDVVGIRQKMLEIKTCKPPGQSWIQIDGSVYEFLAGDRSHQNIGLIYEVLDDVTRIARSQGYTITSSLDDTLSTDEYEIGYV